MLGIGVALGLVIGGDVGVSHREGGPHIGGDLGQRRLHLGRRYSESIHVGSIEAPGELPQRVVATSPHVGEDGSHVFDGRLDLSLRPGQHPAQVAFDTTEIQTLEHDWRG